MLITTIVFMFEAVALVIFALIFTFKGIAATGSGAKPAARHPTKAQMRHQF